MLTPPGQAQVLLLRSLTATRCICILCLAWSIYAALWRLPPFSGIYIKHRLLDMTDLLLYSSTSIDESGHFINFDVRVATDLVQSSTYGTLFNFSRTEDSPLVDLTINKGRIPSQPQPVLIGPSSFRSWFQSSRTMSGQQIDELCR